MSVTETTVEAIRKSVVVNCPVERAFQVFTEGIAGWWPLHTHSISVMDDGSEPPVTAVFEPRLGGRLYERTADGRELLWGTVIAWEPPRHVIIAWHANPTAPAATEIDVRFEPEGGGTRVELEHRGWERLGPELAAKAREDYANGWPAVFGAYEQAANGSLLRRERRRWE